MELQVGKSYLVGKARVHAIDVLDIVEEPGRGTVALCRYYHTSEPHNTQFELYQLDGYYRLDRTPNENWDVVDEYRKPPTGSLTIDNPHGLFDKDGNEVYPLLSIKAQAYLRAKGITMPFIKFTYSRDGESGYQLLDVVSDEVIEARQELLRRGA